MSAEAPTVLLGVMQSGAAADGGVESITRVIERLGTCRPVVVTQLETRFVERWRGAGADVHVWPVGYRLGTPGSPFRAVSMLRTNVKAARLLRQTSARVVHCNDIAAFSHLGWAASALRVPAVLNVRNSKPEGRYGRRWRLALRASSAIVVLSREMAAMVADAVPLREPERAKLRVVYSGAGSVNESPPRPRQDLRRELGIPDGRLAIVVVGAVSARKGQLRLLQRLLPGLARIAPDAHLYFVGDFEKAVEPEARSCHDALVASGLGSHATFVGYSGRVRDWYAAADLSLLASEREGLARAMIESLWCGTPVVSFDVCSAREVLQAHGCGAVVAQGDYDGLLRELRALGADEPARAAMGARGARVARELFADEATAARYEELWLELGRRDR